MLAMEVMAGNITEFVKHPAFIRLGLTTAKLKICLEFNHQIARGVRVHIIMKYSQTSFYRTVHALQKNRASQPDNLMLSVMYMKEAVVKIADFGLAKQLEIGQMCNCSNGTPEVLIFLNKYCTSVPSKNTSPEVAKSVQEDKGATGEHDMGVDVHAVTINLYM